VVGGCIHAGLTLEAWDICANIIPVEGTVWQSTVVKIGTPRSAAVGRFIQQDYGRQN
jgi:hypothetical protein